jgi:hypothetical protein
LLLRTLFFVSVLDFVTRILCYIGNERGFSQPLISKAMKVVAAYLLAVLGGNEQPSYEDIVHILSAGGITANADDINRVLIYTFSSCSCLTYSCSTASKTKIWTL